MIAGAATPERAAVEQVDRALVAEAEALGRLAQSPLVADRLQVLAAEAPSLPVEETIVISDNNDSRAPFRLNRHTFIPYLISQIDGIAGRPWTDLVCSDDYIGPVGGMMRTTPLPPMVTEGAMVVSLNPHLFFVGDSITRCLMQRVRSWMSLLSEARAVCYEVVHGTGQIGAEESSVERSAWTQLQAQVAVLQRCCLSGPESRMRDACIAIVQVYAEFHPAPELGWLGIKSESLEQFKGVLTQNIMSRRDLETLDRIAGALGELQLLYRDLSPEVSPIDTAVTTGGLVLVEQDRRAYWRGELIQRDWHDRKYRNHWAMLWKLALNARAASPVGNFDLYRNAVSNSTIHSRAMRLKTLLPPSLRELVQPGRERATYRLILPPVQIHLFPVRGASSQ